jgi:hypothetical protein
VTLLELAPHWVVDTDGGPHIGLTFACPHCVRAQPGVDLERGGPIQFLGVAFHHRGHEAMDDAIIRVAIPSAASGFARHIWTCDGLDDFESLTLTPSVDASASGHWHGFITNGQVTS